MLTMARNWYHFQLSVAVVVLCYGGTGRFICAKKVTIPTTASAWPQSVGTFLLPVPQDPVTSESVSGKDIFGYDPSVKSPCSVENLPSSGGVFVHCENRDISRIDPRWFPANTTILSLDFNNINRLENNTFLHLGFLQNLSICCSNVAEIQISALRGLKRLGYLNLGNNKLPLKGRAFPETMFVHTPNLRHLYIQNNGNIDSVTEYTSTSMDDKKNCSEMPPYSHYIDIFNLDLESLSIDIFPHVCLGEEFSRFQNLNYLNLSGPPVTHDYIFLTNDTFWGLRDVPLAHLSISRFPLPVNTELGLFQHLHHLKSLSIVGSHFGNQLCAKLMWPFVNRTMSSLHMNYINFHWDVETPDSALEDGVVTKETFEYLREICLADFAWVNSGLFVIESGVVNSPTWRRCLKTVDLSGNYFTVVFWKVSVFDVVSLSALESVTLISEIPYDTSYQIDALISEESTQNKQNKSLFTSRGSFALSNTNGVNEDVNTGKDIKSSGDSDDYVSSDTNNFTESHKYRRADMNNNLQVFSVPDILQEHDLLNTVQFNRGKVYVWIPPKLKRFRFLHTGDGWVIKDKPTIVFKGTDNLLEVYLTYMPKLFDSPGRILGLERLKLLDLSYSFFKVRQDFFDDFPGIEILILRSIFPKNFFDTIMPCKQIIRNMPKLRYIDISINGLTFLFPETFSTNPELQQIILSDNRFSVIPFQLYLTPKLMALDLSRNVILYLDEGDRSAIETQAAKVDTFYLKLEGNGLVCVCSQMTFLVWLDRTTAILDNGGNYSCTSQEGWPSYTISNSDFLGFWRQCNGWSALMTSIVCALVLLVSFLSTYLTARFRCAIKAFMLRLMFPQFRPLTPQDYRTDVIVCYADDDFRFVRHILLGFLEDELQQRTHIHQRDLPVGGHIDDHIHQAIENSWRIMLVITDTFLHRYDMADIMMKFACYAVGPANQGRVFAVVEQNQLNLIPGNLHAVLEDDRIIVVHNLNGPLGYEQKQSIKNCLRPNN